MIGNDTNNDINSKPYSVRLNGSPWVYPLDHYKGNFNITIPFKNVTPLILPSVKHGIFDEYDINFKINFTSKGESTDIIIKMDIHRKDYFNSTITLPIIFVFFFLGAICFLEPTEH